MTGPTQARRATVLAVGIAVLSVAVSAAPRVLLAAGALPEVARPFVWSDAYAIYVERLGGTRIPYSEAFFEYPPVIGYVSGLFVRLAHDPATFVALWAAACAIAAGLIALLLAREVGPGPALTRWSLSPQLLLFGALNFDVLAVLFLVGAVALSRRRRGYVAMVALALGAITKAFPALAAPSELLRLRRERGTATALLGLGVFGATALLIAVPSLLASHPFTEGAAYVSGLTNFDSAWGLLLAALNGIGLPGADRIVAVVSAVGMVLMYLWAVWRTRAADLARAAALATVAILLWTRLYSPQYSLWLVPFFALGALPVRAFAALSLADLIVLATVYPLTLVPWAAGDAAPAVLFPALAVGIVLRHVALVMAWIGDRPLPA